MPHPMAWENKMRTGQPTGSAAESTGETTTRERVGLSPDWAFAARMDHDVCRVSVSGRERDDDERKERIASDAQRPMWRNKRGRREEICAGSRVAFIDLSGTLRSLS